MTESLWTFRSWKPAYGPGRYIEIRTPWLRDWLDRCIPKVEQPEWKLYRLEAVDAVA